MDIEILIHIIYNLITKHAFYNGTKFQLDFDRRIENMFLLFKV